MVRKRMGAGQHPRKQLSQEAQQEEEVIMMPDAIACMLPVRSKEQQGVFGRSLPVMETLGQHKMLTQASQALSTTLLKAGTATQSLVVLCQTPEAMEAVGC